MEDLLSIHPFLIRVRSHAVSVRPLATTHQRVIWRQCRVKMTIRIHERQNTSACTRRKIDIKMVAWSFLKTLQYSVQYGVFSTQGRLDLEVL